MIKNKRGLSTIVTTLIIVALSLVAVGIVWVVVNNIVSKQTTNIDYKAKCLDLEVRASSVTCTAPVLPQVNYQCALTLTKDMGDAAINGAKLVFSDTAGTQGVYYTTDDLATQKSYTSINSGLTTVPTVVTVAVYFLDQENNKQICPGTTTFNNPTIA